MLQCLGIFLSTVLFTSVGTALEIFQSRPPSGGRIIIKLELYPAEPSFHYFKSVT